MLFRRYSRAMLLGRRRLMLPLVLFLTIFGYLLVIMMSWKKFPEKADLSHLKRNRSMHAFLDGILTPLIEPSSLPCQDLEEVPLIILVTSHPSKKASRSAIRETWGKHQPTIFFLGTSDKDYDEQLVQSYVESKQHNDIVVHDFLDRYHNLTLKSALMMDWSLRRCPGAEFVMKTDDDVFVNPWVLRDVVRENVDARLVGFKQNNSELSRDPYNKWYLPEWLFPQENIPEYLVGISYLINGEYLQRIYKKSYEVPLINLEDVYFTYLVAKSSLNLQLTHDPRLCAYKPYFPIPCAYWSHATMHSVLPEKMKTIWSKIEYLGDQYDRGYNVCRTFKKYFDFLS